MAKKKEKQITLTFFDNAKLVLAQFKAEKGDIATDYRTDTLYTSIFDKLKTDEDYVNTMPASTSLESVYAMLAATPRPKTKKDVIEKNFMFENSDGNIGSLKNHKDFFLNAVFSMINFINAAVYIYHKLPLIGKQNMQEHMLCFLIVAASNAYEELYSSRGLHEFAYYLQLIVENNSDLNVTIIPYNSSKFREMFNQLTKDTVIDIEQILSDTGRDTKSIQIANLSLTIGNIADGRINPDKSRYTIEAGIADVNSTDYDRIFISTIKK